MNVEELPYRKSVAALLVSKDNDFLLVQKHWYHDKEWTLPGGCVDGEESLKEALRRQLLRDLGTHSFGIIYQCETSYMYDWPEEMIRNTIKQFGQEYRGQELVHFFVRLTSPEEQVDVKAEEVRKSKWVEYDGLSEHLVFPGQWENTKRAIDEFRMLL